MERTDHVYKTVGTTELLLRAFWPENRQKDTPVPAIVFFNGGGWVGGDARQFFPQCEYLVSRGMAALTAEYRARRRHGTSPFECVADGKSAVRWIREHASDLRIDSNLIAAGGGSAGGHIAACCGVINRFDEPGENLNVSSKPNALILFNPAFDLCGMKAEGHGIEDLSAEQKKELSPVFHLGAELPPTIVFHGTEDEVIPFTTASRFTRLAREAGSVCKLVSAEGREHGFFNYSLHGGVPFRETMEAADRFLSSLGYLNGPPTIMKWERRLR